MVAMLPKREGSTHMLTITQAMSEKRGQRLMKGQASLRLCNRCDHRDLTGERQTLLWAPPVQPLSTHRHRAACCFCHPFATP